MNVLQEKAKEWASRSADGLEIQVKEFEHSDGITLQWISPEGDGFDWTIHSNNSSDITISANSEFGVTFIDETELYWDLATGFLESLMRGSIDFRKSELLGVIYS